MKRNLKESVRDIRKMIGRIDHPTIVEGPGDEEKLGDKKVSKKTGEEEGDSRPGEEDFERKYGGDIKGSNSLVNVVKPVSPNVQKDIENQIMSYIVDNRDAAEVKSALFKKVPKLNLGPSTKLGGLIKAFEEVGADFKMTPLAKQPFSVDAKIGNKFMLKFDWDGRILNIPIKAHIDTTLLQKEKGALQLR